MSGTVLKMEDLRLAGKRVLIREDLNVPVSDGKVTSDARIRAALPTIELALAQGAGVLIMSHLGRPIEGTMDSQYSLAPVADHLGSLLGRDVPLVSNWRQANQAPGGVSLLENVRFNSGEKANDHQLAKDYASLCDVFVMDAFGTAHRAQASTHGVAAQAPIACAGLLLSAELDALQRALASPQRPLVAIVGGSKVSTKLEVLESLAERVDQLIVGGGIANTVLAAAGCPVGRSLCEHDLIPAAQSLMASTSISVPIDVVVAREISEDAQSEIKLAKDVAEDDLILDLGPQSMTAITKVIAEAGTILWNGPVGVFEMTPFSSGTAQLSAAIAESAGFSVAGGGDTLAAIDKFGVADRVSYISTGGGAFLEYVEGKTLPAVAILQQRAQQAH